jgi:hypothetical protein
MERFPAIAFLVLCVSFPVLGQTPDRTVEGKTQGESAIRQLMEDLTVAWNKHEVVSFSMVFVKDADFTNQKAGIRGITSRLPAISAFASKTFIKGVRVVITIQKVNFKANWIIRGLLLVEMMRPKLPAIRTCPVVGSIRPAEATRAFRLLMGLAKFG